MKSNQNVRFIIEIVILSALGIVFEVVSFFKITLWPTELILTFSMIPIFMAAFRWGLAGGLICGLLCGVFPVIFDLVYTPGFWQGIVEYASLSTLLGLAGLVARKVQEAVIDQDHGKIFSDVSLGVGIGGITQYIAFLTVLYIFYGDSIKEELTFMDIAFGINTAIFFPPLVISIVVISFVAAKQSKLILRPDMY